MDFIKNLAKQLLRIFIYLIICILILTVLYYFNIIDSKLCSYLRLICFIIIIYFNSSNLSRKVNSKNVLNGILLAISIILITFITALIAKYNIGFKLMVYFLLILLTSILGSVRKKKKLKR